MVYTAYGSVIRFIKVLDVSSVETIEIEYVNANMEDDNIYGIYSVTSSGRECIGDEIRWDEEGGDSFKIYYKGRNIHNDSDTEEEEEEEEDAIKEEITTIIKNYDYDDTWIKDYDFSQFYKIE